MVERASPGDEAGFSAAPALQFHKGLHTQHRGASRRENLVTLRLAV
jgi:hypothetical protein